MKIVTFSSIAFTMVFGSLSSVAHATADKFIFARTNQSVPRALVRPVENCRSEIQKAMCLVDEANIGEDTDVLAIPCAPAAEYARFFEELYDNYPASMQKMFCSVKRIFIQKQFDGTAQAGLIANPQKEIVGALIGIRKSVLDENLNLTQWAAWKEQLSFGGNTESYDLKSDLPLITTVTKAPVNDFLYFVITHEIGHIFDFANEVNKETSECTKPSNPKAEIECMLAANTWGDLSYLTTAKPRLQNEFPLRTAVCFYWCEGKPVPFGSVPEVYRDLAKTNFLSLYATRQPWDDFADSLGYFLMARELGSTYMIDTMQGESYDIMAKLKSELFRSKYEYLENFLSRGDLVYP